MATSASARKKSAAAAATAASPSIAAAAGPKQRCVILYFASDPSFQQSSFYVNLYWKLMMLGRERHLELIPFIDGRPDPELTCCPKALTDLIRQHSVDGFIGVVLHPGMVPWMQELGLPVTVLSKGHPASVGFDVQNMVSIVLEHLARAGCPSAGLMFPQPMAESGVLELIETQSEKLGIEVSYEWIIAPRRHADLNGYRNFCSLWQLKRKPAALVVVPDIMARGVVSAVLEKNIRVPDDLRLVLHRNTEELYAVPLPCDWVECSGQEAAMTLLDQLETQWAGKRVAIKQISFRIVKGTGLKQE